MRSKIGYWNDWTGACQEVEVKAETTDGRLMIDCDMFHACNLGAILVRKEAVKNIKEAPQV